jgi:PelA/Pel-15E family pectate lyase
VLDQPTAWYESPEARAIADSVLAWQLDTGAWPKNIDMTPLATSLARVEKPGPQESTIDNGATTTQIRFLGRVYQKTRTAAYRRAVLRGIEYLLRAQYPNGGWPQYFPLRKGYYTHITYNDDAMASVMMLLWDVADGSAGLPLFDDELRERANVAVGRGLDVIVKTQIRVDGRLTAWCQQHDEGTLEPRPARTFEPVALVSAESAGLVRVLMRVDDPHTRVRAAVEAAVAWLRAVRIDGRDRWARFYEIGSNRPIFAGRDGIVRYRVEEIEQERRDGYSWHGDYAATLLNRDYPAWTKRLSRPRERPPRTTPARR